METIYDLIIIGSGPAGLSAAIYAQRAKLNTLVLEQSGMSGGQVLTTYEVDNYPGLQGIGGYELGMKMREHADKLGAVFITAKADTLSIEGTHKKITTDQGEYLTRTIIIATGATHAKLGVKGEDELMGMGVSYCATCDGAFFRGKTVAVVGGGDVALEDAIFLARVCQKVYVIHRRDTFRGSQTLQESVFAHEKIEVIWDSIVTAIDGENQVEAIQIENVKTKETSQTKVDGVFVAVGVRPNSEVFLPIIEANEAGYLIAGEEGKTNIEGIYAAGDVRTKLLRQIVTAVSDGANTVTSVQNYLN